MTNRPEDPIARRHRAASQREEENQILEEQRRRRLAIEPRTAGEIVDSVLVELNRNLESILSRSKLQDLTDDELDRMIRISTAVLAINRHNPNAEEDPSTASTADLQRAAGRR